MEISNSVQRLGSIEFEIEQPYFPECFELPFTMVSVSSLIRLNVSDESRGIHDKPKDLKSN